MRTWVWRRPDVHLPAFSAGRGGFADLQASQSPVKGRFLSIHPSLQFGSLHSQSRNNRTEYIYFTLLSFAHRVLLHTHLTISPCQRRTLLATQVRAGAKRNVHRPSHSSSNSKRRCASWLPSLSLVTTHALQIDDLRLTIPRIVEPFHRPPSAGMFKQYAQGVQGSQQDIKTLQEQWRSPEIQAVFEHTRRSLLANSDLSASRSMPAHGWTEREKKQHNIAKGNHSESTEDGSATLFNEDFARIVADFEKSKPSIKLETQDDNRTISVWLAFTSCSHELTNLQTQFVASSVKLRFRITVEYDASGKHKLNVDSMGSAEPCLSINRCIASRPHPNDLRFLLVRRLIHRCLIHRVVVLGFVLRFIGYDYRIQDRQRYILCQMWTSP